MNFTCPPNIKQINSNTNNTNVKTVTDNFVKHTAPTTALSGAVSPTSDFVDDSCVSEDNISSANSSSDQGISIYSTEASPISYHYTTTTLTNNNNSLTNKNRNLTSNINHQPPPASSIVHLSPGGSTVIEYKTSTTNLSNKVQTSNYATAIPLVTLATTIPPSSTTIKSLQTNNIVNDLSSKSSGDNCSQSTPHTHFHKRYLREEHDKMMKQINEAAAESAASAPASIITTSTTTYTIPIKQHYSPSKYEHETVIVENEHPQTTTIIQNHFEHIERLDDYVTPGNSPRHDNLHPPQAPQKSMMITSATPPVTPGSIIPGQSSIDTMASITPTSVAAAAAVAAQQNKQKHPNNLPYDPFIHTNNKPPLSFSSLIFLAIEDAKEKALPVKEIYSWIVQHYPYFKTAPTGWKNSVRHNLSLNKCFQKVEKAPVS